jgi:ribosome-associated protein
MVFSEEIKKKLENECIFSASRSSGPGGQNVNKVNTRIELRFSITSSEIFSEEEKDKIRAKLKNRINSGDELVLFSEAKRSQLGNKILVTKKFFALVEKSLTIQKKRVKTSPSASSKAKRLESKKIEAKKKLLRKPPEF